MRRRWPLGSKALLAVAVCAGVAAFALVDSSRAQLRALERVAGTPVPVVVAADDLSRGASLSATMLRLTSVPVAFAPPGAVGDPRTLDGSTLLTDVARGEPVTRTRVADDEAGGPVAAVVPPGLRAVTVEAGLPAAAVRPSDRVDVLATYGGDRPHTETVAAGLEIARILPSGAATSGLAPDATATGTSTAALVLLVSPDVAERLAYAKAFADLDVSIVGPSGS
jgi:pilus assembly protein CpaB